jgi:hypothetical protein
MKGRDQTDDVFLDCFEQCFIAASEDEDQCFKIIDKLFKFVDSRIKGTRYSDKTMWNLLKTKSIDPLTLSNKVFRKTILDIIPKLNHNKKVVSYLHASNKNMISYQFKDKFLVKFSPINLNEVSDTKNDRLTNYERLEFFLSRTDESESLLNEVALRDLIEAIVRSNKFGITSEELRYYKENISMNPLQSNLLFLFFAHKVGRYQTLYNLKYGEYVLLLIYFKKWLEANGYVLLSKWVTCSFPQSLDDNKRIVNTKEFVNGLFESEILNYIYDKKYKCVAESLQRSNIIARMITTIFSNTSEYLPSFEEFINDVDTDEIKKPNSYKISVITDEVLRLIQYLP